MKKINVFVVFVLVLFALVFLFLENINSPSEKEQSPSSGPLPLSNQQKTIREQETELPNTPVPMVEKKQNVPEKEIAEEKSLPKKEENAPVKPKRKIIIVDKQEPVPLLDSDLSKLHPIAAEFLKMRQSGTTGLYFLVGKVPSLTPDQEAKFEEIVHEFMVDHDQIRRNIDAKKASDKELSLTEEERAKKEFFYYEEHLLESARLEGYFSERFLSLLTPEQIPEYELAVKQNFEKPQHATLEFVEKE